MRKQHMQNRSNVTQQKMPNSPGQGKHNPLDHVMPNPPGQGKHNPLDHVMPNPLGQGKHNPLDRVMPRPLGHVMPNPYGEGMPNPFDHVMPNLPAEGVSNSYGQEMSSPAAQRTRNSYNQEMPNPQDALDEYADHYCQNDVHGCGLTEESSPDYNLTTVVLSLQNLIPQLEKYSWTVSTKVRGKNQRKYYYKEIYSNGVKKQVYVKKKEEKEFLKDWERKKKLKEAVKKNWEKFHAMSKGTRRKARALLRYAPKLADLKKDCICTADGWQMDSKNEQVIAGVFKHFGLEYIVHVMKDEHNPDTYVFDFMILKDGRRYFWEHMGLLQSEKYKNNQRNKMKNYRRDGYHCGRNLIVTTSDENDLNAQDIVWTLAYYGIITEHQAREFCTRDAKLNCNIEF